MERTFGAAYATLCRRTKKAWDSRGILNPGVKIPDPRAASVLSAEVLKVGPCAPSLPAGIAAKLREIERSAAWGTFRLELA